MELDKKQRKLIFAALLTGSIATSLLQTALTTALPVIMKDLQISALTAQWLTSSYTLVMGIMVPATAFLLKRFPTRNLFLTAMSIFAVGALFCATSNSFEMLLLGRILQAIGNGMTLSMTQVVILTIYPLETRGAIMGIYGMAVGVAPVFAPTLAGAIIDVLNWQSIFWLALIIVVIDLILAAKVLQNVLETEKIPFDLLSMILCACGFSGILLGLGNMGAGPFFSFNIGLPLVVGVITLTLFSIKQVRSETPFLNLKTLRNRDFLTAVILSMLLYSVMMAGSTLIPIYIQTVRGLSAMKSGLIMMPGSLVMALISPFAGKLYDKFGIRRIAIAGSGAMMISCFLIASVGETTSPLYIAAVLTVRLIGIGIIMMPLVTWGMNALPKADTAHGTAILTSMRTIAGAIGSAVFVAVMTMATEHSGGTVANITGMNTTFMSMAVVSVLQFAVAILFAGRKKRK